MELKLGKKGQMDKVVPMLLMMVVVIVTLFVGLFLYVQVLEALTDTQVVNVSGTNVTTRIFTGQGNYSSGLNSTLSNSVANVDSGFSLMAILPIVMVALLIIGFLTGFTMLKRKG